MTRGGEGNDGARLGEIPAASAGMTDIEGRNGDGARAETGEERGGADGGRAGGAVCWGGFYGELRDGARRN